MTKSYKLAHTFQTYYTTTDSETYDNYEDALKRLYDTMEYIAERSDDYQFFRDVESAEAEITFAEEAAREGDWDAEEVAKYVENIRYGISTKCPFLVSRKHRDLIVSDCDHFTYDCDNYTVVEETL